MKMNFPCRSFAVAFDHNNHELLAGCADGKVQTLNLTTGHHGVVLNLPEPVGIIRTAMSSNQNALCCTVRDFEDQKRPTSLQIWNYRELYASRLANL